MANFAVSFALSTLWMLFLSSHSVGYFRCSVAKIFMTNQPTDLSDTSQGGHCRFKGMHLDGKSGLSCPTCRYFCSENFDIGRYFALLLSIARLY